MLFILIFFSYTVLRVFSVSKTLDFRRTSTPLTLSQGLSCLLILRDSFLSS